MIVSYDAMSSPVRFENKKCFLLPLKNALAHFNAGVVAVNSEVVCRIGSWSESTFFKLWNFGKMMTTHLWAITYQQRHHLRFVMFLQNHAKSSGSRAKIISKILNFENLLLWRCHFLQFYSIQQCARNVMSFPVTHYWSLCEHALVHWAAGFAFLQHAKTQSTLWNLQSLN
jgi:hypothetical protein